MEGHSLSHAASSQEALARLRRESVDLIVSDVRIEGEPNGIETVAMIQQEFPYIRSIIMTGFADSEVPLRAASLLADDYLIKPFKLPTLVQSVQNALKPKGSSAGLVAQSEGNGGWGYQPKLRLLEQARTRCMQQFVLLIRSRRLKQDLAYAYFCDWEIIELDYLEHPGEAHWERLRLLYESWATKLSTVVVRQTQSQSIPMARFGLLFLRIQAGVVSAFELLKAIRLYTQESARRESFDHYTAYHWLWSETLEQGDPFLGLTLGGFRLAKARTTAGGLRLYEAKADFAPRCGDLVICVPDGEATKLLVTREIFANRAQLLAHSFEHTFLLYRNFSLSLRSRLPRGGMDVRPAWKLLRPVFLQVRAFHAQGQCSGCFALEDIECPPNSPAELPHFGPEGYRQAFLQLRHGNTGLSELHAAPEVLYRPEPTPASDLAVLGRILFEMLLGGEYPDVSLALHLRRLGQPDSNRAFAAYVHHLGPAKDVFYRLAHANPAERLESVERAIEALDGALS